MEALCMMQFDGVTFFPMAVFLGLLMVGMEMLTTLKMKSNAKENVLMFVTSLLFSLNLLIMKEIVDEEEFIK